MSHLTTVTTEFRNVEAIKAAAKALGISVLENAQARMYSGLTEPCELMLQLPGRYDLGLKRQENGTYLMICDDDLLRASHFDLNRAGHKAIGLNANRLKVEYSFAVLQAEARRKGRQIQRQELPNGRVRVIMSGGR